MMRCETSPVSNLNENNFPGPSLHAGAAIDMPAYGFKGNPASFCESETASSVSLTRRAWGVENHYRSGSRFVAGEEASRCVEKLPVTRTILDWVGTGRRVLDLGCHWGDITALIQNAGNEVIGVDLPASSARARQIHGLNIVEHDLNEALPFSDADFDVVVASSVLDDIPDDLFFLAECCRVLRHGGAIIVNVPNEVSWYRRLSCLMGKESRDYGISGGYHTLHRYGLKGIKSLLVAAGFRVVRQAKGPKRFSRIPFRYWIELILPITFATDIIIEAVKPEAST